MRQDTEVKIGSTVYDKINAARMSEIERRVAINAMRDADAIVALIVWATKKIEQFRGYLFRSGLKPSLKH